MSTQLTFGTDGIRGNADQFPFDDATLHHLGSAIARWCIQKGTSSVPHILIADDGRTSGSRIKQSLINGLSQYSITITDAGLLPTPGVMHLIQSNRQLHAGIVISASHNPYQDNGIKIFDALTGKLNNADEQMILELYHAERAKQSPSKIANPITPSKAIIAHDSAAAYRAILEKSIHGKPFMGKKVVIDCANGATSFIAPQLFESLGATVITLATSPNGTNINDHCGAVHPEIAREAVLKYHADIGFAFDGDGDRVVAISRTGDIKDGDDVLALLLTHPEYTHTLTIVGTIMTNQGLDQHCKRLGKQLYRAQVGEKHVTALLDQYNLILGSEPSGHIIIRSVMNGGDGMLAAIKLLEATILTDNWDLSSFEKFPQIMINIPVQRKDNLTQEPYATLIKECEYTLHGGRLIVRYSGTENKLRVMVEDDTHEHALDAAHSLANKLQTLLS